MPVPVNPTTLKYSCRGQLRQVYVITEYRDGCVYRTKSVGLVIASSRQPCVKEGAELCSISTRDTIALNKAQIEQINSRQRPRLAYLGQ